MKTKANLPYLLALGIGLFFGNCANHPNYPPHSQKSLEKKIEHDKPKNGQEIEKRALLVSGDIGRRENPNFETRAYRSKREAKDIEANVDMLKKKNFNDIYVLEENRNYGTGYDSDGICSKSSISKVLNHFSRISNPGDITYILFTGHGGRKKQNKKTLSTFKLPEEDLGEVELKKLTDEIEGKKIIFADICYGGGFAKRFSKGKYVGVSSSQENEISYSSEASSFNRLFAKGIYSGKADQNGDNKVSIREATQFAKTLHHWTSTGKSKPIINSGLNLNHFYLD